MKQVLAFIAIVTLAACGKDKFKTVPQVKIKSLAPSSVTKGQIILLQADVTDKEGDATDTVIFYRKVFSTFNFLVSLDSIKTPLKSLAVPDGSTSYELQKKYLYGEQNNDIATYQPGEDNFDRRFTVGVYIKDKQGNRSEYAESDTITLKKIRP